MQTNSSLLAQAHANSPAPRERERDRDRRHRTRDRERDRDRGDVTTPLAIPSPLALPSPAAVSTSKRKPSAPGTSAHLGGSAVALAPQSRRASGMVGTAAGTVTGTTTGTGTGTGVSGAGAHPYAVAGAGGHMRGASQGQGQGRYGYFGEANGNGRRVVQDSGMMNVNGGVAAIGMGMETPREMGVQDGEREEHDDRRGFLGVLCCR
jgi:hypothetical protein